MFQKVKQILSFFLILAWCSLQNMAYAIPPEEIVSQESMMAQSISGEEALSPYIFGGEALVGTLQEMIGFDTPGSSIAFNRKTGQLFIRTTPSNHTMIETILNDLRKAHKRQIEIETRIITIASDDFEGLGADLNTLNYVSDVGDLANPSSATVFGTGTINSQSITTSPIRTGFPDLNTIFNTAGIGGAFSLGVQNEDDFDLDILIDALARRADVNTLAAPKISVFNNQLANISIKTHEFYIAEIDSSFETRTIGTDNVLTSAQDPDVRIAPSGTLLDVTPTINSNGSITLELHPIFVRADTTNTQSISVGAGLPSDSVTLPVFTSQEINTTVTIENGGVVALGGLISEEERNQHDKVPVLGDIPLVGKLFFQHNQTRNIKTHLLMFVKATIKNVT